MNGDGTYNVRVHRLPHKSVPASSLAPFFLLDEAVVYTPKETGGKNKPAQVAAKVTSIDVSIWPPAFVIKEDSDNGKGKERDTEGGRIISAVLAAAIAADQVMQALLEAEATERAAEVGPRTAFPTHLPLHPP